MKTSVLKMVNQKFLFNCLSNTACVRRLCTSVTPRIVKQAYDDLRKFDKPPYSHICQIGDPVLQHPTIPVEIDAIRTTEFQHILGHMTKLMPEYHLSGLSAPQIGLPWRLFLFHYLKDAGQNNAKSITPMEDTQKSIPTTLIAINPIVKVVDHNLITMEESCASIWGYAGAVPRYAKIKLKALNEHAKGYELAAEGWTARVIQHEFDHMDGNLYLHKMKKNTFQFLLWNAVNEKRGNMTLFYKPKKESRILKWFGIRRKGISGA